MGYVISRILYVYEKIEKRFHPLYLVMKIKGYYPLKRAIFNYKRKRVIDPLHGYTYYIRVIIPKVYE